LLQHTHASILAMRAVPMAVIARQLGHANTRMTERHYAHLAPNYVADTIRASFPRLAAPTPERIVRIRRAGRNSSGAGLQRNEGAACYPQLSGARS
jgi:hypothetical protein